jgi:hypothetical protein
LPQAQLELQTKAAYRNPAPQHEVSFGPASDSRV